MKRRFQKQKNHSLLIARLRYALLWILICVAVLFYQSYLTYYIWMLVTLLPLVSWLLMKKHRKNVILQLEFSSHRVRTKTPVMLYIKTDTKKIPLAVMQCRCELQNVFYDTQEEFKISMLLLEGIQDKKEIETTHCGLLKARITSYELYDLLGLWKQHCDCCFEAKAVVLPEMRTSTQIHNFLEQGLEKEKETLKQKGLLSDDSYEIREYQMQDSLKRLHHKMTYKLQKPMIRQYAYLEEAEVLLLLDLQGDVDVVEQTLMTTQAMVKELITKQVGIRLCYRQDGKQRIERIIHEASMITVFTDILSKPRDTGKLHVTSLDQVMFRIHGCYVEQKGDVYESA